MKAVLICPDRQPAVALLASAGPLAVAPLLGKCLLEYWIEHLLNLGVRAIVIAASDRPDQVRTVVGDGVRWGLSIVVIEEAGELSSEQAAEKHGTQPGATPALVVRLDHLPGQPGFPIFGSYAAWFAAIASWMPRAQVLERIGQCEMQPGVWIGLRTRIAPSVQLLAPCWIGDYVKVHANAVIGPGAILEDGVVIAAHARVTQSAIGPDTFVGAHTRVENSLAHGHVLVNWATNSCLHVPDAFWLSSLRQPLVAPRPTARRSAMRIEREGDTLTVTGFGELGADNADEFQNAVHAALAPRPSIIAIDLAEMHFVDGCGLATLCALHRSARALGINLQLLHPEPTVRQLFELTQALELLTIGSTQPARSDQAEPALLRFASAPALVPSQQLHAS